MYSVLVGKMEGKRPLGRHWLRWLYKIRMDLWGDEVYRYMVGKLSAKETTGET